MMKCFSCEQVDEMRALVLARIRQLAAHEVGHTLGPTTLPPTNNRASVMDHPVPLLLDADGTINGSRAYAVGVGEWDTFAVRYLYEDFGSGEQERAALQALVAAARQRGLRYVTDEDTDSGSQACPVVVVVVRYCCCSFWCGVMLLSLPSSHSNVVSGDLAVYLLAKLAAVWYAMG